MKILILSSSFYPVLGGIEVCIANLAKTLTNKGHDVTVFTSRPVQKVADLLPYEVRSYPPGTILLMDRSPKLGRRYLEMQLRKFYRESYDVWHVFQLYPFGWATCRFIRKFKVPAIVSARGVDIQCLPETKYGLRLDPKLEPMIEQAARSFEIVTCLSKSVEQDLRSINTPASAIRIIPNGVDRERFSISSSPKMLREELDLPTEGPLLVTVGRNHPKKNFQALIPVVATLKKTYPDIHCCIVGSGARKLRSRIHDQGLDEAFILREHVDPAGEDLFEAPPLKLIEYYKAADCFVFPSLTETFGIVLIEAMAAGTPVVTADVPGCRDVVIHMEDGILTSSPERMAEAVGFVLEDDKLRASLIKNGLTKAGSLSWNNVTGMYLEQYQSVIAKTKEE